MARICLDLTTLEAADALVALRAYDRTVEFLESSEHQRRARALHEVVLRLVQATGSAR